MKRPAALQTPRPGPNEVTVDQSNSSKSRPRARALRLRRPLELDPVVAAELARAADNYGFDLRLENERARIRSMPHPSCCVVCGADVGTYDYATCGAVVCVESISSSQGARQ